MADLNYRFTGVNKAQLENEVRLLREGERGYGPARRLATSDKGAYW
jgi:hypothetical protein